MAGAAGGTYTVTFTGTAPTGYKATVLADAPAVYYRLADTSGTTAADASGNNRTGTYGGTYTRGAASLLTTDADLAVTMTNGQIDLPTSVNPWAGAFTIEAWVKPSQVAAYAAIFSRETYGSSGLRFGQQGNRWGLWTTESGGNVEIRGGTVVSGTTYHVVATRSGTTFRLYVNGVQVATGTGTLVTPTGGGRFASVGGAPYKGVLDEVAIYPTALSAARIAAHYAGGHL
jgi:hypothetical protein